jgi:hypothetical protein
MQSSHPYIKAAYDLIMESESKTNTYLDNQVEEYLVLLFANNFQRTDIGEEAIAIQMLEACQVKGTEHYQPIADECLLIHSYPLNRKRWPTETYYMEMGMTAYGLANIEIMESNFEPASRVLRRVFKNFG